MHWTELIPHPLEVLACREKTGDGLADCERALIRENVASVLRDLTPETKTETALVACLTVLLHERVI